MLTIFPMKNDSESVVNNTVVHFSVSKLSMR